MSAFLGETSDLGSGGWKGRGMEAVNLLPGSHFDITSRDVETNDAAGRTALMDRSEIILVVFIGGVTFSEISCLRFLTKLSGGKNKFVIATSHLMNGTSLLKSFQDPVVQKTIQLSEKMRIE